MNDLLVDHPISSGVDFKQTAELKPVRRRNVYGKTDDELHEIIRKTESLSIDNKNKHKYYHLFVDYINPLLLTLLAGFVRLYRINASKNVLWDEAHFGKFGSYYLKHEFYFDVHPPLGKLLVGLSGYLAGYDGSFKFDSGVGYPPECNYVFMRIFNCVFGILCTPLAYKTAVLAGYNQYTVWFISLLVVFEMLSLTLSKFILLDSMLLFFTVTTYYCLIKLHTLRLRNALLTYKGLAYLCLTGVSIGCVCSVKLVGLFVTVLVGLYTIYDLLIKTYQMTSTNDLKFGKYVVHWASRIFSLIMIPFSIYLLCFKIHFSLLTNSGPGDGSISTLLQLSLNGNNIKQGPRSAVYGSLVTLRSQGLSPNLLHSHSHLYPEGSRQQQITTYGHKDSNNNFIIEFDLEAALRGEFASYEPEENDTYTLTRRVKDGETIRLVHQQTHCLLHSHAFAAPILKNHFEVSCYANLDYNDKNDEWIVEIQNQLSSPSSDFDDEDPSELHPISTNFRLRHKALGCYLATTGSAYPLWGFLQGEVVCKHSLLKKDKSTWWNIEDHVNDKVPTPETPYVPPNYNFWKEFVLLNYGMMASNNALVPDPDKFDRLSSEWWEWPSLHVGLRMGSWSVDDVKYFLIGHPFVTWFSTLCLGLFLIQLFVNIFKWQRQKKLFDVFDMGWNSFLIQGIIPFIGWFLHYFPFIIMQRVTYVHHYVPALYFAIFVSGFVVESMVNLFKYAKLRAAIYAVLYLAVLLVFWHYRHFSLGMEGRAINFQYLKLLDTWMV